jgi:hypothetical protein
MDLEHGCVCWDYVGGDRLALLLCIGHLEPEHGGVLDGCVRHGGGLVGPRQAGLRLLVLDLLVLLVLNLLVLDLLVLDLLDLLDLLVLDCCRFCAATSVPLPLCRQL